MKPKPSLTVLGGGRTVFFRYVMPLVPLVCVFAGVTAAALGEAVARSRRLRPGVATAALDIRSAHTVIRRSRWQNAALADCLGVAAQALRTGRSGDRSPGSGRWSGQGRR
jgi:hypothetical protein